MTLEIKDVLAATLPGVLPTLMVLIGILTNKNDINNVRTAIASMRGEMSKDRSELRTELRTEIASVRTELGAMRTQLHTDIMTLVNISNDLDKRVSRLEDKS
jgi:septal ring factor EnvC (AmiA/AmiB activator)